MPLMVPLAVPPTVSPHSQRRRGRDLFPCLPMQAACWRARLAPVRAERRDPRSSSIAAARRPGRRCSPARHARAGHRVVRAGGVQQLRGALPLAARHLWRRWRGPAPSAPCTPPAVQRQRWREGGGRGGGGRRGRGQRRRWGGRYEREERACVRLPCCFVGIIMLMSARCPGHPARPAALICFAGDVRACDMELSLMQHNSNR